MRDQAVIDKANARIEQARADLDKARRSFDAIFRKQKKIIEAEEAKEPMTLERALTPYFEGSNIENEEGYKWLNERQWKGAWKGLGIMTSGYWRETLQTCVQIGIPRDATEAKLDEIAKVLEDEIIPVLKPGAMNADAKLKKDYGNAKVINVFDDDCGERHDYKLFILPDGTVHLTNTRYYYGNTDGSCIYKGNLRGALTVVRNNLSYN